MIPAHRFRGNLAAGFTICIPPGKYSEVVQSVRAFRAEALESTKPADRTKVLGRMREMWGSEADFDEWMHGEFAPFVESVGGGAPKSSACIVL